MLDNYPGIAIHYQPGSKNVKTFYGLSLKSILGVKRKPRRLSMEMLRDLVVKADKKQVLSIVNAAIEKNSNWNIEYRIFRNGQTIWLREQGHPAGTRKAPAFDIFIQDVTEFKNLSRELSRQLDQANNQASFKNEFFASISHEIRTPMNAVMGIAQVLSKTMLDAEQKQYVSTIMDSTQSLVQIINDILDFSKLEAGKIDLLNEEFDLEKLCLDVCQLLMSHASEKQLSLYLDFKAVDKRMVFGDKTRVRQVLVNLIGNAIKFTPSGYVKLHVDWVKVSGGSEQFKFKIEDTGIGISKDAQSQLFQAFSQANAHISQNFGGTGLGLRICQQLVDIMGGSIGVESEINQGTIFWFSLPLEYLQQQDFTVNALAGKKVLIVENDPLHMEILLSSLQPCGMQLYPVMDSEDVLAMLALPETYDLFVINRELQGLDGLKLTNLIKGDSRYKSVPILLLTSIASKERASIIEASGASAYTSLPLSPTLLYHAAIAAHANANGKVQYISTEMLAGGKNEQAKGKTISGRALIVDDIDVNRLILNSILSNLGLITEFAENGKVALEKVQANNFDLVFMDCRMPVMDGYAASGEIRKLDGEKSIIPIIALTANAGEEEKQKCLDAGMSGFLSKPFMEADLLQVLEEWMPDSAWKETVSKEENETEAVPTSLESEVVDSAQWDSMQQLMESDFDDFILDGLAKFERYKFELADAFGRGSVQELVEKAHALKGISALLGAKMVSEIASKIEVAGEEREFEIISINLSKLGGTIQETSQVMKGKINPELDQSIVLF